MRRAKRADHSFGVWCPIGLGVSATAGDSCLRPTRTTRQERELEPREIVQEAIDADHDHDLDRCLGYYAPDVVVKNADSFRVRPPRL